MTQELVPYVDPSRAPVSEVPDWIKRPASYSLGKFLGDLPVPNQTKLHNRTLPDFLDAIRKKGTLRAACQAVGIERQAYRDALKKYPPLADKVADAEADHDDFLYETKVKRGVDGDKEERIDRQGNIITINKKSDKMLESASKDRKGGTPGMVFNINTDNRRQTMNMQGHPNRRRLVVIYTDDPEDVHNYDSSWKREFPDGHPEFPTE